MRHRAPFVMQVILMSILTLISRLLGFIRELFFVRIVGARALSDAFLTASRIPTIVYELCIGGACGPALLPTFIMTIRTEGMEVFNGCVTAVTVIAGIVMLTLALFVGWNAESVIRFLAPGFTAEQVLYSVALLPVIALFMVTSALAASLAEALRALRCTVVPAAGQAIVNSVLLGGLVWYCSISPSLLVLGWSVVAGGMVQVMTYAYTAWHVGIRLTSPSASSWRAVRTIMARMLPCMVTAGVQELALFIELQFASYLPTGSVSLLTYASSFVRLPFGIFICTAVSALLPDLAHKQHYAPRRVPFLIAEALICAGWIVIPVSVLLYHFSYDIFATLYLSAAFPLDKVVVASNLLALKAPSLLLLTINHIMIQLFYVRHQTFLPTLVSLVSTACNVVINLLCMRTYGLIGIAIAGVSTICIRTLLFIVLAAAQGPMRRYFTRVLKSWICTALQTVVCMGPALGMIHSIRLYLRATHYHYAWYADSFLLWPFVGVICGVAALIMFFTRRYFGIRLYLIDHRR